MMLLKQLILTLIGLAGLVELVDHVIFNDNMCYSLPSGEKGTAYTLLTNKDVQFAAALVRNLVSLMMALMCNY